MPAPLSSTWVPSSMDESLPKTERLCGKTAVVGLFEHGKSLSAGCLRCKYMIRADEGPSRIVVSVPKRHFKRAVKRNRVKRQIREAYRLNKEILYHSPRSTHHSQLFLAFIWQSDEILPTAVVEERMKNLLTRLSEKL